MGTRKRHNSWKCLKPFWARYCASGLTVDTFFYLCVIALSLGYLGTIPKLEALTTKYHFDYSE